MSEEGKRCAGIQPIAGILDYREKERYTTSLRIFSSWASSQIVHWSGTVIIIGSPQLILECARQCSQVWLLEPFLWWILLPPEWLSRKYSSSFQTWYFPLSKNIKIFFTKNTSIIIIYYNKRPIQIHHIFCYQPDIFGRENLFSFWYFSRGMPDGVSDRKNWIELWGRSWTAEIFSDLPRQIPDKWLSRYHEASRTISSQDATCWKAHRSLLPDSPYFWASIAIAVILTPIISGKNFWRSLSPLNPCEHATKFHIEALAYFYAFNKHKLPSIRRWSLIASGHKFPRRQYDPTLRAGAATARGEQG